MLIPDANVLLYAVNSSSPQHDTARRWLEGALGGHETVGFDWVVLSAFVRISTHASILPRPLMLKQAWDIVEGWLERPISETLSPGPRHAETFRSCSEQAGIGGNLTSDAHLAAMCVARQARIVTFDRDFDLFEGVSRVDPS